MSETQTPARTTKRKFAHELYPHADEWEVRPLAVEVPYLYAKALGLSVWETSWHDQCDPAKPLVERREAYDRISSMVEAQRLAFLADALLQGLTGDAAWAYAASRQQDVAEEFTYERAVHYGVDPAAIKPYSCGPEPSTHAHYSDPVTRCGLMERIPCPESECTDCTEWVCTCTPEQVDLECAFHNDHPDRRPS